MHIDIYGRSLTVLHFIMGKLTCHKYKKITIITEESYSYNHIISLHCTHRSTILNDKTFKIRRSVQISIRHIYTTKIDGVVCPPNISETVAGRLLKVAHRQRIASTTIKLIKKNVLSILSILVKTIQLIVADPGKTIQPIRIYLYESRNGVARTTFRLDRFRKSKPFTQCLLMR